MRDGGANWTASQPACGFMAASWGETLRRGPPIIPGWKLCWRCHVTLSRENTTKERKKQSRPNKEPQLFAFFGRGSVAHTSRSHRRGQQEVGGLLPSPLITLNDSNGHTLKSNPLIATQTCTCTLDTLTLTWHSTRTTPTLAFVLERLIAVGHFHQDKTQTSGLLFLFLFSVQSVYSLKVTWEL